MEKASLKRRREKSIYKGVSRVELSRGPAFHARIAKGGRAVFLGSFDTELQAARAYNREALRLGDGRSLNPIPGEKQGVGSSASSESDDVITEASSSMEMKENPSSAPYDSDNETIGGAHSEMSEGDSGSDFEYTMSGKTPEEKMEELKGHGFDKVACEIALQECRGNLQRALKYLTSQAEAVKRQTLKAKDSPRKSKRPRRKKLSISEAQGQRFSKQHAGSKYKGVHQERDWWVARITLRGKTYRLGKFDSEEAAARAYNKKAAEWNRRLNAFPKPKSKISNKNSNLCETEEACGVSTKSNSNLVEYQEAASVQKSYFPKKVKTSKKDEWNCFMDTLGPTARQRIEPMLLAEHVDDLETLRSCSPSELKDLGLALGDRKRIAAALQNRS
mmetsp:Transcript_30542/g.58865  ORF Transcript_30542/g.58865 Transcript_30542/m.58865 type:complete len:390 (-) Transcript_30542:1721-2890(-)